LLLLSGLAPVLRAAQDPACAAVDPAGGASIEHVIDGDTVILGGGEHVRMVGIDTPELGHGGAPDQPGAAVARDWLRSRLTPGSAVISVSDRENRDRHGRLLRHLFLPDGTNLQADLLTRGLAMPLVMPPSVQYLSCYQRAAENALQARSGLWGQPEYQPAEADTLPPGTRGFRIVRGRVMGVHWERDSAWLDLGGRLSVTIPAGSLGEFDRDALAALPGQRAEFRGMVYPQRGRLRLYLRHPVNLVVSAGAGNPVATDQSR